jgi:putative SOS response-associated peptidase YedK
MCNEFAQEKTWQDYVELMGREAAELFSEAPEALPFGSIRPSERAAVLRAPPLSGVMQGSGEGAGTRLDLLPWGWAPPGGGRGLVINIRSENRRDPPAARGVAPMDRFYEFRGEKPPKSKFAFTPAVNEPLGFAVVVKDGRFALLTTAPNPDVAPIHGRMPVTLRLRDWRRFLTAGAWPADLTAPAAEGTLQAAQIR